MPQTVTVTGVDDAVDDGNIAYTITDRRGDEHGREYNGAEPPPTLSVTNTDNDTRGHYRHADRAADDDRSRRDGDLHRGARQPADGDRDHRPELSDTDGRHGQPGVA